MSIPHTMPLLDNIIDYQEDYLRKTIEVKNKNIEQLLKQLKETQQIYQDYKQQYLDEERKLKIRGGQLVSQLEMANSQLEQFRVATNRLKGELQASHQKQQQSKQHHLQQSRQFISTKQQLQDKCRTTLREITELKRSQEELLNRYNKIEAKYRQSELSEASLKEQVRHLNAELVKERQEREKEKTDLEEKLREQQERKKQKLRTNQKLDSIEQRIIDTIKKI